MENRNCKERKRYNHLSEEINAAYHELSLLFGLSDSAMIILYTICDSGDSCLLHEICRHSGLSKQTVNSAIRKLEAEHVVYLEAVDGRNKNVCLTARGKQLASRTAMRIIESENEIFAAWTKQDVENYLALTERFLTDLREQTKKIRSEEKKQ